MKWYVSLYEKHGTQYTLLNYVECANLDLAKLRISKCKPQYDCEEYRLESKLGSLDNTAHNKFNRRVKYAPSNSALAKSQHDAEDKAQKLLKSIRRLSPNAKLDTVKSIALEITLIKPMLTVAQYQTIMSELARQPICRKILTQFEATL